MQSAVGYGFRFMLNPSYSLLVDEGHLGNLRLRLVGEDAAEGHGAHGAERHSFTGVRMGAPLPFSSTTTNLAGSVLLALRPTT